MFSSDGTLISASAAPHCREMEREGWGRQAERERERETKVGGLAERKRRGGREGADRQNEREREREN